MYLYSSKLVDTQGVFVVTYLNVIMWLLMLIFIISQYFGTEIKDHFPRYRRHWFSPVTLLCTGCLESLYFLRVHRDSQILTAFPGLFCFIGHTGDINCSDDNSKDDIDTVATMMVKGVATMVCNGGQTNQIQRNFTGFASIPCLATVTSEVWFFYWSCENEITAKAQRVKKALDCQIKGRFFTEYRTSLTFGMF